MSFDGLHPEDMLSAFDVRLQGIIVAAESVEMRKLVANPHREALMPIAIERTELVTRLLYQLKADLEDLTKALLVETDKLEKVSGHFAGSEGLDAAAALIPAESEMANA